jgi:hypothetical protein
MVRMFIDSYSVTGRIAKGAGARVVIDLVRAGLVFGAELLSAC